MNIHFSKEGKLPSSNYYSGSNYTFKYDLLTTEYKYESDDCLLLIDCNLTMLGFEKALSALKSTQISHELFSEIFNDNFFIVILKKETGQIEIFRDVSGVKSGYISFVGSDVFIGSIVHDVALISGVETFDEESIVQLLYSDYLFDGQTIYSEIQEVKMGTQCIINESKIVTKHRIKLHFEERDNNLSEVENILELREQIEKAHLPYISECNTVFLSGGLDSIAMLIAVNSQTNRLNTVSYKVKGTQQDETEYAVNISKHLEIENTITTIDPQDASIYQNFEKRIMYMNNPYVGMWIFGSFDTNTKTMFYAGQDSRLHTPSLNDVDKLAFRLFRFRKILLPLNFFAVMIRKFLSNFLSMNSKSRISRGIFKLTFVLDPVNYIKKFYFKLSLDNYERLNLPIEGWKKIENKYNVDWNSVKSRRDLYNKIVKVKWREQYINDIRYLQDIARLNKSYIAMPFYNQNLVKFSSSIPFSLSVKTMIGRKKFGNKKTLVNKYILRKAFRNEMTDKVYYRDKAVSQTLHLLFNGILGQKIKSVIRKDLDSNKSFIKKYEKEEYVKKFMAFDNKWKVENEPYLLKIYTIGTLCIYNEYVLNNN